MKTIRFDSVGGASGDMILSALVDLGADVEALRKALGSLPVDDFRMDFVPAESHGLHGLHARIHVHDRAAAHEHHHHHDHGGQHRHDHHHELVTRKLADVEKIIRGSGFPPQVQENAVRVFTALADAEGRVHGKDKYDVHFHEVAAMDSIIDIIGSCLALDLLGVDRIVVGPLPLGRGTVKCAHGVMPVPVPAVVELLKGMQVDQTDEPFELVTPTGAALLSSLRAVEDFPSLGKVVRSGTGFGTRSLRSRPNLIRATLFEASAVASAQNRCHVLECDIDDMNPELLGDLSASLLAAGALDVVLIPVFMKKNRPGTRLSVLCEPGLRDKLVDLVFRGATTFGLREHSVERTVLARRFVEVATPYGPIRVKVGTWNGEDITRSPEMGDCIQAGKASGVSARVVYEAAQRGL